MSAEAAVDFVCDSLGIGDRDRIGVGGHSYGGFMTANLLVHTDLFRTGIARSGAYNRTLTPFGFQSEQRNYWEATEVYTEMSPFTYANRMNEPILLIHGEADDIVPLSATLDWARPQALPVVVVPGAGHFFHGQLPLLKSLVVRGWSH